ncbi:hypothetical protein AB3538_04690 [Acinetobacter baumannii]
MSAEEIDKAMRLGEKSIRTKGCQGSGSFWFGA